MKKFLTTLFSASLLILVGCRDESLSPLPGWEPGVHGFTVFTDVAEPKDGSSSTANYVAYAKNLPLTGQDAANTGVNVRTRWVSLDNKLTVNKVEIVVDMIEAYTDKDGNPKTISLGGGGKVFKTITPAAGNREWNNYTITAADIYNLYKDATVKYDGTNAVKVFENPAKPRPASARIVRSDVIVVSHRLTTTDGLVFRTFNQDSICGDPTPYSQAKANCTLTFGAR